LRNFQTRNGTIIMIMVGAKCDCKIDAIAGIRNLRLLMTMSRSQWPRGLLSYVRFPAARTLGSWVLIPLEAWINVVLSCVGLIPRPRSPAKCPKIYL